MPADAKTKAVLARIESIEAALVRAREYLDSGQHAHWHGFRPLFATRQKNGTEAPPHRDWVTNVFIPRMEKALRRAEAALDRLEREGS